MDVRRRHRQDWNRRVAEHQKKEDKESSSSSDSSDEEESDEAEAEGESAATKSGRLSAKASYMVKVNSPLLGYGTDFALTQYVYDLNLWSTLGSKKNLQNTTAPLRLLMKGHSAFPQYWRT
eukprot:1854121-Karenia_brevis.AAC.1